MLRGCWGPSPVVGRVMPRAAVVAAPGLVVLQGCFLPSLLYVPRSVSVPRDSYALDGAVASSDRCWYRVWGNILINGSAGGSAGKHTGKN